MFKRCVLTLLFVLALLVFALPAAAQETASAADLVPADFAGFIRIHTGDAVEALQGLNEASLAAAVMQPTRVTLGESGRVYFDFIPFATLFDVEGATFADNIFPWLGDDLVLAYRTFDGALQTDLDNLLIIIANQDMLGAVSGLGEIIRGQDLADKEVYRDITIFLGDKTTIAITEQAVLIGPLPLVKVGLDVQAGAAPALTEQPAYRALQAASPEAAFASAYITTDYILPAVNGLLNGDSDSQALLQAFGGALSSERHSFEQMLFDGGFDAAAVSLVRDRLGRDIQASAIFHNADVSTEEMPEAAASIDPTLLEMIPQNALLVHSGADFRSFISDSLKALPLSNFASQILAGLPFATAGTASDIVSIPAAADVQTAVSSFVDTLKSLNGYDVQGDLLAHLNGGYALALLPRPNNRLPLLNTPFDLLLVGQVDDGEAAGEGVITLLETVLDVETGEAQTIGNWSLTPLTNSGEVIFTIGYQNDRLLVASGDSAQLALDAGRGDNRLINLASWQQFAQDSTPNLYVDAFVFYNTFFPLEMLTGGIVVGENNRQRLAASAHMDEDGLYHLDLTVTLPQG